MLADSMRKGRNLMQRFIWLSMVLSSVAWLRAADQPPAQPKAAPAVAPAAAPNALAPADAPKLRIIPGKVLVPTGKGEMRRIWGELVSLDRKTRTGTFRNESNDEVMSFVVMPYAELLHHATLGDLQDFRVGERAIFRLHENDSGQWVWLTYIQDEMRFLHGHKEYYWVDKIDADKRQFECTDANADKSDVRMSGIILQTDGETRFWRNGEQVSFADVHVGDKLRTKTHGVGKGKDRVCWEVFLDEASVEKFLAAQNQVHRERMIAEGLPGYVDEVQPGRVAITLFPEGGDLIGKLAPKAKVRVAPAGVDRQPTSEPIDAVVEEIKPNGRVKTVTLKLDQPAGSKFEVTGLARLWNP